MPAVLETAAYILNDDSVKDEISKIAEELREQGLLDEKLVSEFVSTIKNGESTEAEEAPPRSETEQPEGTGRKYSYGKKQEDTTDKKPERATPKPQTDAESLYERIKKQVAAEDLKKGYEFLGKLDLSKIRSLVSNRAELKKYIRNTLTDEEYAELIELYIKYSYLLNE